ncbi:hypothetical protein KC334_g14380 [Hortaea werneckii]|nr:hypothetical protein KC334_g14380 [Hortaea werneckii]KAI6952544.1 hypothetical protein KC355_g13957 [Hortaea werneckii]
MASTEGEKQEHAPEQNKPEQVEEEGEIAGEPKQTQEEHKSSSGSPEKSAETVSYAALFIIPIDGGGMRCYSICT